MVAIFVKKGEVCEWSAKKGGWNKLDPEGELRDRTLARPLRVKDLLDAAEADNAVARALLTKNNPVLAEATTRSRDEGLAEGKREAIEVACDLLGIKLTEERRARLNELDVSGLEALLAQIRAQRRWP